AGRDRRHRTGDIVGEADHPGGLDAGRGFEFVERDDWAWAHVDDLALHAEIVEDSLQETRVLLERVLRNFGAGRFLRLRQHRDRWHDPFASWPSPRVDRGAGCSRATGDRSRDRGYAGDKGRRGALNARRVGGGDSQNVVGVRKTGPGRGGWR